MIDTAWAQPEPAATVAFAALTVALLALWWPRLSTRAPVAWWGLPFNVSLAAGVAGRLIDARGLFALFVFAAACVVAAHPRHRVLRATGAALDEPGKARPTFVSVVAHAIMLSLCAGLLLHVVPGFENPRALDAIRLSPDAAPYTKYLSFDKGVAGLFLLGLYAPRRTVDDPLFRRAVDLLWRLGLLAIAELGLSVALGFVRWDPRLPGWWPGWLWSMVFLTALPEEAIFRGVAQRWLAERLSATSRPAVLAALIAGTLFGVAHIAGGPAYVILATVAGIGYGWIYASTGSIAAAIAAHAGLNTLHFLLFTYPASAGS